MHAAVETVRAEYEARAAREHSDWGAPGAGGSSARDERLLEVGPEGARLLSLIAHGLERPYILEIGTSYGYSTLWLAEAAKARGGKVVTLELADYKQAYAANALSRAGLADVVEFRLGDALKIVPTLPDGIDMVFLDLWKDLYVPSLDLFHPKLAPGAVIVADNMLRPAMDRTNALAYRRAVRAKPGITSVLLDLGQGLEVSRFAGPLEQGL
jgi:predicted O-methyltransferase YrrM